MMRILLLLLVVVIAVSAQFKHIDFTIYKTGDCTGDGEVHKLDIGTCHKARGDEYVMLSCTSDGSQMITQVYSDEGCKTATNKTTRACNKCETRPNVTDVSIKITCDKEDDDNDWVTVPGGMLIHKDCIFEMENGGVVKNIGKCEHGPGRINNAQVYAMDAYYKAPGDAVQKQMNASWTIPSLPSEAAGQTVYFWPGFKSTSATMGLPVLQPVLQYGQQGATWYLQSWFVWGQQGISYTAPAIPVSPGDVVSSYMEHVGTTWTVFGRDQKSGRVSNLHVTDEKVHNTKFKIAHVCCETIMRRGNDCREYPASGAVKFTGITLQGQSRHFTTRETMTDCNQKIEMSGTDATFTFNTK